MAIRAALVVLAVVLNVVAAADAGVDLSAACKEAKAKAAGKKAGEFLKAFGKNAKKADPARLGQNLSKARSKFTKAFTKAESKGGCDVVGDSGTIEAKVDAFVVDTVGEVTATLCSCCGGANLLTFQAQTASASCGTLRNFRCSNDLNQACATDGDCLGTCDEVMAGGLPLDLACGGLYPGAGLNSIGPLPFRLSNTASVVAEVTSCDGATGAMTLGPTTAAETGSNLTCTSTGCLFGAPVPFANAPTPPVGICGILTLAQDASGTATCEGTIALDVSVDLEMFLTGDLFTMSTPPNIPGVQSCPLCDTFCVGGANADVPCDDDSECNSGNCANTTTCLGGPNDGLGCTPGTSDSATLGDTEGAFPTSQNCPPDPVFSLASTVFDVPLTTSPVTTNASDLNTGPGGQRVFCGFCRDNFAAATGCFEGNTAGFCPPAIPAATGTAVSCATDADCADADEYESCAQRNPGAFSQAASTRLSLNGSTAGECLSDAAPHAAGLVADFCIPPTFDATADAVLDFPGPGAMSLQGILTLSP